MSESRCAVDSGQDGCCYCYWGTYRINSCAATPVRSIAKSSCTSRSLWEVPSPFSGQQAREHQKLLVLGGSACACLGAAPTTSMTSSTIKLGCFVGPYVVRSALHCSVGSVRPYSRVNPVSSPCSDGLTLILTVHRLRRVSRDVVCYITVPSVLCLCPPPVTSIIVRPPHHLCLCGSAFVCCLRRRCVCRAI